MTLAVQRLTKIQRVREESRKATCAPPKPERVLYRRFHDGLHIFTFAQLGHSRLAHDVGHIDRGRRCTATACEASAGGNGVEAQVGCVAVQTKTPAFNRPKGL